MIEYAADMHVHTVLSPCADAAMRPAAIVEAALARGLAMVAICDHNASANVGAVRDAAAGDLVVVAGIEITTCEEVHVIGWFASDEAADAVAARIESTLPRRDGFKRGYRAPEIVDALGEVIGQPDVALESASSFSLSNAVALIREHHGLAVAAHVDRQSFSVLGQLGFWPEDLVFDAIEVSSAGVRRGRIPRFVSTGRPIVTSSDAHSLDEIGATRTVWTLAAPRLEEIPMALAGIEGRGFRID